MSKGILSKMLNIMGLDEDVVDEVERPADDDEATSVFTEAISQKRPKVVNIRNNAYAKIVVCQVFSYDDAQTIVDHLRNRQPVIINLEALENGLGQRILDFTSGAVYALEGNVQRISKNIFLAVPSNISISGNAVDDLKGSQYASFFSDEFTGGVK